MPVSRSLIRSFIGAFIIYIGVDLGMNVYRDGGNPLFYIPAALFVLAGAGIGYYYYRQHNRELEEGDEEDDENAESRDLEDSDYEKESGGGFFGMFGAKEKTETKGSISEIARMDLSGGDDEETADEDSADEVVAEPNDSEID